MYGFFEYGGHALGTGTGWGIPEDANEYLNHWRRTVYPDWFPPRATLSPAIVSGSFWNGEIWEEVPDSSEVLNIHYPIYKDWFPKPSLSPAIVSGSFWDGKKYILYDYAEEYNVHYPVYPDWFPKPYLSPAIMSGSFWMGEIYKMDRLHWRQTEYPDWFPKPFLSPAIQSGHFWVGEIYRLILPGDQFTVIVMLNDAIPGAMQ